MNYNYNLLPNHGYVVVKVDDTDSTVEVIAEFDNYTDAYNYHRENYGYGVTPYRIRQITRP